ncbi:spore coat protein [Virgibacillus sp. DJP39]|uniref:spore coat protein n=1 Tax=Virgibacillus sp. DJP39 TaxID=3409790 RepID=UPI003BB563A7
MADYPNHLAWHETLEVHELVAFQSLGLMKLKESVGEIKDKELRLLYVTAIKNLEKNIHELLKFYKIAPNPNMDYDSRKLGTGFYSGDLLVFAKTAVRNYAIAITETATPVLRETLTEQLLKAILLHGEVYEYMNENGLYPSYDLEKLLKNDVRIATKALDMSYRES